MRPASFCALLVAIVAFAPSAGADPINSIFIQHIGSPDNPPLTFEYGSQNDSLLTVFVESFTLEVQRDVGGPQVPEFIPNVTFSLTAEGLTDVSVAPLATGMFSSLSFHLRDENHNDLLTGSAMVDANLIYSETTLTNIMLLASGAIPVTGGSLAGDFGPAATVSGLGFLIDPSTTTFGALNVDHEGAVMISLNPIPEPGSVMLWGAAAAVLCGARRRRS